MDGCLYGQVSRYTSRMVGGWMDGQVSRCTSRRMDGWMDRSIDWWIYGSMNRWADVPAEGWMDGWMDGRWMNGWMDVALFFKWPCHTLIISKSFPIKSLWSDTWIFLPQMTTNKSPRPLIYFLAMCDTPRSCWVKTGRDRGSPQAPCTKKKASEKMTLTAHLCLTHELPAPPWKCTNSAQQLHSCDITCRCHPRMFAYETPLSWFR